MCLCSSGEILRYRKRLRNHHLIVMAEVMDMGVITQEKDSLKKGTC